MICKPKDCSAVSGIYVKLDECRLHKSAAFLYLVIGIKQDFLLTTDKIDLSVAILEYVKAYFWIIQGIYLENKCSLISSFREKYLIY